MVAAIAAWIKSLEQMLAKGVVGIRAASHEGQFRVTALPCSRPLPPTRALQVLASVAMEYATCKWKALAGCRSAAMWVLADSAGGVRHHSILTI
jgi:hypothetical protein